MAKSVNKVILVGRLGKDPELKYTSSGTPFCRFSMATDDVTNLQRTFSRDLRRHRRLGDLPALADREIAKAPMAPKVPRKGSLEIGDVISCHGESAEWCAA